MEGARCKKERAGRHGSFPRVRRLGEVMKEGATALALYLALLRIATAVNNYPL